MRVENVLFTVVLAAIFTGGLVLFCFAWKAFRAGEHLGIFFMILASFALMTAGNSLCYLCGWTGLFPIRPHQVIARMLTLLLATCLAVGSVRAEDAAAPPLHSGVTAGGLLDGYWGYDFEDPFTKERPYTTQALRHNEPRVNLGMLQVKLDEAQWRGRLAVQAGDSVKSNYAAEQHRFWRYIQESSLGTQLADGLWIDAGIYLSHIGLESFNSPDNFNYTRSLVAEYSPYYETGAKLTYAASDTVSLQGHILRGWQNISSEQDPAFGGQVVYTPDPTLQLMYANFLGNQHGFRNFHDFVLKKDLTDRLSVGAELDIGNQNQSFDGGNVWWHGWTVVARYKVIPDSLHIGARVERYSDPHQVVLQTASGDSFSAVGLSANIDYKICNGLWWRNEYRYLTAGHDVFPGDDEGEFKQGNNLFVTSLAYSADFGRLLE